MRRSCRGHGFESHWSPDFFRLLLSNCLNWKIYCDDHSSLSSTTAVQNELFHVYFTSIWSNLQIHFFIKASWKIELITEIRPSREERITVSSNYTAECVSNTKKEVGPLLISFNPAGGARMARWWEHSIPTNVSWVRVLVLTPDVSWVCCWFSPLPPLQVDNNGFVRSLVGLNWIINFKNVKLLPSNKTNQKWN